MATTLMCIIPAILLCHVFGMSCANPDCSTIKNCSCVSNSINCQYLKHLPSNIPSAVTEFMFDECPFGTLSKFPYDQAEVLAIRDSALTDVTDGVLQNLTSLKTLDLSGNKLASLRKDMFRGLDSVTDLILHYNGIKEVKDDTFENLPNMVKIDLSENPGIHISENAFSNHKQLKHIMLGRCDLDSIPIDALSKAEALTTLELLWNPLGTIPANTLSKMPKLQVLNLFGCSLTTIPAGAFDGLKYLVYLNLAENKIVEIPGGIFRACRHSLQTLYLNDNKLKTLSGSDSGGTGIGWQNLHALHLGGNPWTCDCNLQWMKGLDLDRIDDENVTCAAPESVAGRKLHEVTEMLSCSRGGGGGSSALALGIAIPIIIICLLLIAFFIYKIMQTRRQRAGKKSVRYSEVYKDTVETTPKEGAQQPLSVL